MHSLEAQLPGSSLCPRCGAGFRCGNVAGDAQCWCAQLPLVMPVPLVASPSSPLPTGASCYCPGCLKQITDERSPTSGSAPD